MKPKTTFLLIALLVVSLFAYWGFDKQKELERGQYYYELTHFPKPTDAPTPTKSIDLFSVTTKKPTKIPTPTPNPCIVLFNQKGETFSEYNDEYGLRGSARIDDIYFEDEWSSVLNVYGKNWREYFKERTLNELEDIFGDRFYFRKEKVW